jgi:molybdopterin/thiamine biosynthesis adenylyltransferase
MGTRFDRQRLVPEWDQNALTQATVVVVGVGALGNEVARILAMSGVGTLMLCDPDRVEESNLSRAVLFSESDVGRPKVEAAVGALSLLAPATCVVPRALPLVNGVGLAELRDASLVLSCLDTRSARLQLAGRCSLVSAPWIDGGTHPWGGEVRPYLDVEGPCYGCSLTAAQRATVDAAWSCFDIVPDDPAGASAPVSVLVGAWMATLALRFLMGAPCADGVLRIDAAQGTMENVTQARDPACPLHSRIGVATPVQVRASDRVALLRERLPSGGVPLLWESTIRTASCPACGFHDGRWGDAGDPTCPDCGTALRLGTTLELTDAPDGLLLTRLGIAPREILAVRTDEGYSWVELIE